MALVLEENEVLSKLSSGDVASNELYYNKSCYKIFLSRYQQAISKKLNSNKEMMKNKENLVKAMILSQIVNQVYDQKRYESVFSFEVSVLEKLYLNLLSNDNIIQTSHVSRLCDLLLDSITDLEKRTINNKLLIIFFDDLEDVLFDEFIDLEDFVKLVDKVVNPIRKAMENINNKFSGNLVQNCQQNSIPTELITFVSMLIEGNNISNYTSQNI